MVKVLSRDAVQRMTGRRSSATSVVSGGGDSGVSQAWVEGNYISKNFFNQLFTIHGTRTYIDEETEEEVTEEVVITPNSIPDGEEYKLSNVEVSIGLWTSSFLSALGLNSDGSGGATDLAAVWESLGRADGDYGTSQINISHLTTALSGYATTSAIGDMATKTWVTDQGYTTNTGTVTSVAMSVPTGFDISGTPITSSGTLALTFAIGYSLPTTAKQSNWDTAYGWGDHSLAGYLTSVAFSDLTSHPTTLAGYGITDAKIASGVITLGTNTITPWTTNNHPTTLSGYGITDALGSGTTFWGQSVSNGVVSGSLTSVGSITSSTRGSIDGFNKIEFYSTTQSTGTGGGIYFHFPGVSGYSSAYIQEDTLGVLSLYKDVSINRDLTVGSVIYQSGNYILMNQQGIGLMIEGYAVTGSEYRATFGFHPAGSLAWIDNNCVMQLKVNAATGEYLAHINNGILQIGDARLVWDSTNNALKAVKADGTAINFYTTGGVSALGMSAGVSQIDAMKFNNLSVTNSMTLSGSVNIVTGTSSYMVRSANDSDCIYLMNYYAYSKVNSVQYYYNQYYNVGLHGTDYNYSETWFIDPDGCARFSRVYLNSNTYIYTNGSDLLLTIGSTMYKLTKTTA